jgi:hypothetical protein
MCRLTPGPGPAQWAARASDGLTVGVTATAQHVFSDLLRRVVAPALREQGLRGSGQSYSLPDENYWAQVGFQRSTASTHAEVRFTVNLLLTEKAAWDAMRREHSYLKDTPPEGVNQHEWDEERLAQSHYPKQPSATGGGGVRIGHLIPGIQGDHWWRITPDDTSAMDEALDAVLRYGLPHLRIGLRR